MSDPLKKKPCKTDPAESQSIEKLRTLVKRLTSTGVSYISRFITRVKGFLSNKQISGDDLKGIICKTESRIKEVYEKFIKEVKVFQENDLQAYQRYSKEELTKFEIKFKDYSIKMKDVLGKLIKHLQSFKNQFQSKIMSSDEVQSFITHFEKKIDQTKKLTQDMIQNIHETIKDPELKKKLLTMVETNYKKVKGSMDALYSYLKETDAVRDDGCIKSESINKSFKSTSMSYISRIITYVRSFIAAKSARSDIPISQDVKGLLHETELKIKELYNGILEKVKDLHEKELQNYKKFSKEELAKVTSHLQDYSTKLLKISEDMLDRLKTLKNQLQTQITTREDFQTLISYFEDKVTETKKLTEQTIRNIQATVNEPTLEKKLQTIVETNSKKIKIAMDDLYAALQKNVTKFGKLESFPEKNNIFSTKSKLGEIKSNSTESSASTQVPLQSNKNEESRTNYIEGNEAVGLNREKTSFFNLSKHFNSKTMYGRANVAKATYAGVLIYYIYRKVKNSST